MKSKLICMLLLFLLAQVAYAVPVKNLYQANVPVNSQSQTERAQVLGQALAQVLIKVSGNINVNNISGIKKEFKNANKYMQQYSYTTKTIHQNDNTVAKQQYLQATFDPDAINRLLQQNNIPIWGNNRPLVLLWLAVNSGQGTSLISSNNNDSIQAMINDDAALRGLPVIFPLLDLQDMNAVNINTVWGNYPDIIVQASQRYSSDAELIGRVSIVDTNQWVGRWTLLDNGQEENWQTQGSNLEQVLADGVSHTANALASRYSIQDAGVDSSKITMVVSQIKGVNDYAKVTDYLMDLAPVKNVAVESMGPNQVTFSLYLEGSINTLKQAIKLDKKLIPVQQATTLQAPFSNSTNDDQQTELRYRWAY